MKEDGSTAPEAQGDTSLLRKWKFQAALNADPELTNSAAKVAFALLDIHNNEDGYARPGHKLIAKRAGTDVSTVKRALASLKERGWFCIAEAWTAAGDQDTNRYYPIWKRAEGQAPAGSERPRKAARDAANRIIFQAGPVRLTAAEVADIEEKVGIYGMPFFDGLRKDALDWHKDTWRTRLANRVATYAEDDEIVEPADDEEEVPF